MKVLFIGGTGIISTASTALAAAHGFDLWLLTRSGRLPAGLPQSVQVLQADIHDTRAVEDVLHGHAFDAVVNWVAYSPADIERDLALFRGKTRQYIFISSASAYQKSRVHPVIREDTPLENPFWDYARAKIACEERLLRAVCEEGFPGVIVRPSLTYGDTLVPLAVNSWNRSYTAVDNLRRGLPVIVPGDGTSLWTITHNTDFAKGLVGLLGREEALGEAFHITSDEVLTWDQIYRQVAEAAGVAGPRFIHIPSDFIGACLAAERGSLLGDKAVSALFDNGKIKRFVPGYAATTTFAQGIRQTLAWFDADASRRTVDAALARDWARIVAHYETGLASAKKDFGQS